MEYKNNLKVKDEIKDEFSSKDEAKILLKAKEENKQIIVYATAKSCYFCKKMDKEVLGLDDIKTLIKKGQLTEVLKKELCYMAREEGNS